MIRECGKCFALVLLSLAVNPGLADIVPVSSTQNASASGFVFICDNVDILNCGDGSVSDGFVSPDGSPQSVSATLGISTVTSEAGTTGGAGKNGNGIGVGLSSSTDISGLGSSLMASSDASNQVTFVFDLTKPALVHLTGSVESFLDFPLDASLTPGGDGIAQILITGPKFQFGQSCQVSFLGLSNCSQTFDQMFSLDPGTYTLSADAESRIFTVYDIFGD